MKQILALIIILAGNSLLAQNEIKTTASFTITGEVKTDKIITIADFTKWKEQTIGDVIITNHLGEKKSEAKGLKGILLKEILQSVEIKSESPKVLSEYYFVCKATDGYKVVFSWNEIFNSKVGESVFIVTEKNGVSASKMNDSILLISPQDFKTGRRHVKSLSTIEIKRAN